MLRHQGIPVNRALLEARGRAGLEAAELEAQFAERAGDADSRGFAEAAALGLGLAGVHEAP